MDNEHVRVIHDPNEIRYLEEAVEPFRRQSRTEAQRAQDEILDKAADAAARCLAAANEALEWLGVVATPKNRQLPAYAQHLVDEVAEVRRMRG